MGHGAVGLFNASRTIPEPAVAQTLKSAIGQHRRAESRIQYRCDSMVRLKEVHCSYSFRVNIVINQPERKPRQRLKASPE